MTKPWTIEGGKGRPRKVKLHTRTAQETVRRMFAPSTGTPVNMMEEASKSMQDILETMSDMDVEEQKKRTGAPALMDKAMNPTMPSQDTMSPEYKKTHNKPVLPQTPTALFQGPTEQVASFAASMTIPQEATAVLTVTTSTTGTPSPLSTMGNLDQAQAPAAMQAVGGTSTTSAPY